jgi:hypothetical protein
VSSAKLDYGLVNAIKSGVQALPSDIEALRGYMRMIEALLHEKASELEPSWEQATAIAGEIDTLNRLEAAVAERAIVTPAGDIDAVRGKLAIWRALGPGTDESDERAPRNRLIESVDVDLARIAAARIAVARPG